jgi:hypothetical protein
VWKEQRAAAVRAKTAPAVVAVENRCTFENRDTDYRFYAPNVRLPPCSQILKDIEQVYPIESPDPPGFRKGLSLRPYQRQSLAFMLDIEKRIADSDPTAGKGGMFSITHSTLSTLIF